MYQWPLNPPVCLISNRESKFCECYQYHFCPCSRKSRGLRTTGSKTFNRNGCLSIIDPCVTLCTVYYPCACVTVSDANYTARVRSLKRSDNNNNNNIWQMFVGDVSEDYYYYCNNGGGPYICSGVHIMGNMGSCC